MLEALFSITNSLTPSIELDNNVLFNQAPLSGLRYGMNFLVSERVPVHSSSRSHQELARQEDAIPLSCSHCQF